jgi:hypothetical protein
MSVKYTDPVEVSAQVKTYAWLVGNINIDNSLREDQTPGLLCIGYMISNNVDAMIRNYDKRLGIDSLGKAEEPDEA